jgi:hypothetical protein
VPISLKRLLLMRIEWKPVLERGISYGASIDGAEIKLLINQVAREDAFYTLVRDEERLELHEAPAAWTIPVHPRNEGSS